MNCCKTCAHWRTPDEFEHRGEDIVRPMDPDTYEPMKMPFEVRACRHPKLLFCERPVENPGFAVADYFAGLYTSADFGCALHEPTITRGER